jgi:hypothetical protein
MLIIENRMEKSVFERQAPVYGREYRAAGKFSASEVRTILGGSPDLRDAPYNCPEPIFIRTLERRVADKHKAASKSDSEWRRKANARNAEIARQIAAEPKTNEDLIERGNKIAREIAEDDARAAEQERAAALTTWKKNIYI